MNHPTTAFEDATFEFAHETPGGPVRPAARSSRRLLRFPDCVPPRREAEVTSHRFGLRGETGYFAPQFEATSVAPRPATAAAARMVNPARVSCARLNRNLPLFQAIGTRNPVEVLEAVCQRAVAMLNSTVAEMSRIRERVRAGEPPAWPLVSDQLGRSLQIRMLMRVEDPRAWTGRGPRTAEQIIRWLTNIRNTIAGGGLRYTCLATNNCQATTWAFVFVGVRQVFFCRSFWQPKAGIDAATHREFQAQTMIHEVSHIYYGTSDRGRGPGHAECISQFVAEANGSPIDEDFIRICGGRAPTKP